MTKKFSGIHNQTYRHLIISYTVILLVIAVLVSGCSYFFFLWNYNEEIKKHNEQMMNQKKDSFSINVIDKVTTVNHSILSDMQGRNAVSKLFDEKMLPSDWRISQAYKYLQNIVALNSKAIESISVYYRQNDIFLSTISGVNHIDSNSDAANWMLGQLNGYIEANQTLTYDYSVDIYSAVPEYEKTVKFYSTYPLSSLHSGDKGLMCISVKNSFIEELLNISGKEIVNMSFFLTPQSERINSHSGFPDITSDANFYNRIETGNSFFYEYSGKNYVISSEKLDSKNTHIQTGWIIVNASLTEALSGRTPYLLLFVIVLTGLILLLGFLLARSFSKRIYRPLKDTVSSISDGHADSDKQSEYTLINEYINTLRQRVTGHQSLLYETVLTKLFTMPLSDKETEAQLRYAGITFPYPQFVLGIVKIGIPFDIDDAAEYILLPEMLKDCCEYSFVCHAVFLDKRSIGLLINAEDFSEKDIQLLMETLLAACKHRFKLFISMPIWECEDIHSSYSMLVKMQRYEYFFPYQILFSESDFFKRNSSTEHIKLNISSQLPILLRQRKKEAIQALLEKLCAEIQENPYSYEECQRHFTKVFYIISEYIKEAELEKSFPPESVHNKLNAADSVYTCCCLILEMVESIYQMLDHRDSSQSKDAVNQIQDYILANLEKDISLDDAAELVSLSPQYISRLFRDSVGVNFITFIKRCKMEKAKELLLMADKNVDQVALELGYNSTAYFIKNFKDSYGITPKAFQRHNGIR